MGGTVAERVGVCSKVSTDSPRARDPNLRTEIDLLAGIALGTSTLIPSCHTKQRDPRGTVDHSKKGIGYRS
jgi:hypothetical protein